MIQALGLMRKLESFDTYNNGNFGGNLPFPEFFGDLPLKAITTVNCIFSGEFPSNWRNLNQTLETLNIKNNKLFGVIPKYFGSFTKLRAPSIHRKIICMVVYLRACGRWKIC